MMRTGRQMNWGSQCTGACSVSSSISILDTETLRIAMGMIPEGRILAKFEGLHLKFKFEKQFVKYYIFMSRHSKKLIDLAKHARRISYRIKDFFSYKVMVNTKHVLFVGGRNNPFTNIVRQQFKDNWNIVQLGLHSPETVHKVLDPSTPLSDLVQQAKTISTHYDAIIIIEDIQQPQPSDDILAEHQPFTAAVRDALVASYLAPKILVNNGFICFAIDEKSYLNGADLSLPKLVRDCQLQHLSVNLGDREDLETDTLVLTTLVNEEHQAIAKFVKMWSDGIKRPASGTFVQFKRSEHKKPVVYPELL